MSRSPRSALRSGDPRVRGAAASGAAPRSRRHAVAAAAAAAAVLVGVAVIATSGPVVDESAREHARVACDMAARADEAAASSTAERMAAAVLLLDQAVVASERAVSIDDFFTDLDSSVRAVHTAGHRGEPGAWAAAMTEALDRCRASLA